MADRAKGLLQIIRMTQFVAVKNWFKGSEDVPCQAEGPGQRVKRKHIVRVKAAERTFRYIYNIELGAS